MHWGVGEGRGLRACLSECVHWRGCVLVIHQMGTADAEILNIQRF